MISTNLDKPYILEESELHAFPKHQHLGFANSFNWGKPKIFLKFVSWTLRFFQRFTIFFLSFVKVEHSLKRSNSLAIYIRQQLSFLVFQKQNDWRVCYKLNLIIDTALNFEIKMRLTWNSLSKMSWIYVGRPIMHFRLMASANSKYN
jgi:hypothetical protein